MVRLNDREMHERVDHLLRSRSALRLSGKAGFVALNEGDVPPPWTAEFWVWRSPADQAARTKLRSALEYVATYSERAAVAAETLARIAALEENVAFAAKAAATSKTDEAVALKEKSTEQLLTAASEGEAARLAATSARHRAADSLRSLMLDVDTLVDDGRDLAAVFSTVLPNMGREDEDDDDDADADAEGDHGPAAPPQVGSIEDDEVSALGASVVGGDGDGGDGDDDDGIAPPAPAAAGDDASTLASLPAPKTAGQSPRVGAEEVSAVLAGGGITSASGLTRLPEPEPVEVPSFAAAAEAKRRLAAITDPSMLKPTLEALLEEVKAPLPGEKLEAEGDDGAAASSVAAATSDAADDGPPLDKKAAAREAKKRKAAKRKEKMKRRRQKGRDKLHGVKWSDKVKEVTAGHGGRDTLAASERCRLQLEAGTADQVGFSLPGEGEFVVDVTAPRGKWLHVAYVAFAPPKKRIAIYVDGELAGFHEGLKVSLPLREIGDRERSLDGMLQEVRYWGVQRTKKELRENMHALLPRDAPQHGLLGWWTFEEVRGPRPWHECYC